MNIVYNVMVFLHIIGAAMIVGIWIGQMKKPTVHPRQFDGAMLQLITGIVMMGLIPALDMNANYAKLGVKLVDRPDRRRPGLHWPPQVQEGRADQQGPREQRWRPGTAQRCDRDPVAVTG